MTDREKNLGQLRVTLQLVVLQYTMAPFSIPFLGRSPRALMAWFCAAPCLFAAFLGSYKMAVVLYVVAAVAWVTAYKLTPKESWGDRLCKILTVYQPVDEVAYQALLRKIKEGELETADIFAWIQAEKVRIANLNRPAAEQMLLDSRLRESGQGQPE